MKRLIPSLTKLLQQRNIFNGALHRRPTTQSVDWTSDFSLSRRDRASIELGNYPELEEFREIFEKELEENPELN